MPIAHDVQQGAQRGAGDIDAGVVKIVLSDALLCLGHDGDALREKLHALQFGAKHGVGEDGIGEIEDPSEKCRDETFGDPPPKLARRNFPAFEFEVTASLEVAVLDEKSRIALGGGHPRPDFRHEQADVVIDANVRPDVTRCSDKDGVAGE